MDGIELRKVSHAYSGVPVLREIDLQFVEGRVHGLVGQNGAGKSTIIKILTGAEPLLRGEFLIDGVATTVSSPADAQQLGIGVVHQDVQLFPHLSVARNIYAVRSRIPRRGKLRLIDWHRIDDEVDATLSALGMKIDVRSRVGDLETGEQKLVEIARTMMLRPRFLILDEPTASLEARSSGRVLDLLARLRDEGVGVMFVSHRLEEIRKVSDQITVLRDGRVVVELPRAASQRDIVHAMLGDQGDRGTAPERFRSDVQTVAVAASGLQAGGDDTIAFTVDQGEILGFTGLVGSGAERVMRMLGGAEPLVGRLEVFGALARIRSTTDAASFGIGYIPEDRKREGLVAGMSVAANISLASLSQVARRGLVRRGRMQQRAEHYREAFSIKCDNVDVSVRTLSGGNQQKVLIAKWLAAGVRILIVVEPTHGVDVGGKAQIHDLLREFAEAGGTVIVFSAEAEELVGLCHRLAVFRHGKIVSLVAVDQTAIAPDGRRFDNALVARLEDIIEAAHVVSDNQEAIQRV